MDIMQNLQASGGLDAIASQLGISREEAERGAGALLPSLLDGFGRSDEGEIEGQLQQLGGGGLADNVIGPEPTEIAKGNQLLGRIFGSKDVSRQVATQTAQSSGVNQDTLKKMLPILAMLVGGLLMKRSGGAGGGLGSVLGGILGQMAGGRGGMGGGLGGGLGGVLGSVLGGALGRR